MNKARILKYTLDKNLQRPVVRLESGMRVMVDTGASIPVWLTGENVFEILGGQVKDKSYIVPLTGMGKHAESALVGRITLNFNTIKYINMPILVVNKPEVANGVMMLMAASNFDGMRYTIDKINNELIIEVPDGKVCRELEIKEEGGELGVYLCKTYNVLNSTVDELEKLQEDLQRALNIK